jgi:4-aminobutyrate aminotransferase
MKRPEVKVPPPGPKAQEIIERDEDALVTTTKTSPVVAERAEGAWVEDVDGNRLLDFTSGIAVTNTGHGHPHVVEAIQDQADELVHFAGTDFYYEAQVETAERLNQAAPGTVDRRTFFANSGTESIEAAMKIARHSTDRPRFLAFRGAFHGRTLGSLSLTASKLAHQRRFFPTTQGVEHAPYPDPYRNPWDVDGYEDPQELTDRVIDYIENQLFGTRVPPDEVAACFVEPIQGEGGYVVPPDPFFPALEDLLDEHDILLAVDEVQAGFGRTGEMFACEHWDVVPDILCLAKGIASGMPMGATVARAELDFPYKGAHSNTYGGNLVACAAAQATLDVLQDEELPARARRVGARLRSGLKDLADDHDEIGDVRGKGLMLATDFVEPGSREPDGDLRDAVLQAATERGLVLLPAGASAIRYIPPLTVEEEAVDTALELLEGAIVAAQDA